MSEELKNNKSEKEELEMDVLEKVNGGGEVTEPPEPLKGPNSNHKG